ncbi:nitroreductase family protein [Desulfosporosinus sp. BG]|uniref:nitroreductase family protein n=1 Tax=Desulfosporosinus sp. BG TaxID=1633135 RepID=UPI00083A9D1E|nr:nitroreductase family protein [Desulfosporosinus sp. BG]ODA40445.1 Nitroreductase [Desulfosporosinus sp. BG]
MNETISTILSRRSIRAYKQEQIKDADLQLILKAGMYAPSAMNQQSWHFTVVQDKDTIQKINQTLRGIFLKSGNKRFEEMAKSDKFNAFYNAPTWIIISGDEKAIAPQCDCTLAMGNLFLAASSIGIGSCWIHALTHLSNSEEGKALMNALGIPQGYKIFTSGVFGYAAVETPTAAPRKENTVTIIN